MGIKESWNDNESDHIERIPAQELEHGPDAEGSTEGRGICRSGDGIN